MKRVGFGKVRERRELELCMHRWHITRWATDQPDLANFCPMCSTPEWAKGCPKTPSALTNRRAREWGCSPEGPTFMPLCFAAV